MVSKERFIDNQSGNGDMTTTDNRPVSRRRLFQMALATVVAAVTLQPETPEAKPKWGNPPGWSRGRKRGWSKRGGPKWR
jgi:hypothetical protein